MANGCQDSGSEAKEGIESATLRKTAWCSPVAARSGPQLCSGPTFDALGDYLPNVKCVVLKAANSV